jgi:predicted Zn-dependent protease
MNNGDLAIEKGDEKTALEEYGAAEKMFPGNTEMKFWHAVALVNINKLDSALPIFKKIFTVDKNYIELTRRILPNGLLKADEATLKKITTVH